MQAGEMQGSKFLSRLVLRDLKIFPERHKTFGIIRMLEKEVIFARRFQLPLDAVSQRTVEPQKAVQDSGMGHIFA